MLHELRLESTGHLGRLDREEWSEMMAEMRRSGVALGSRNKLRVLVAAESTFVGASSVGWRRGRADDESSVAAKQASEQESTSEPTTTTFGVSGDSAWREP